jgi:hypothetical protein
MRILLLFLPLRSQEFFAQVFAQQVRYTLRMSKPETHYFEVEMELVRTSSRHNWISRCRYGLRDLIWCSEFASKVNLVRAKDAKGNVTRGKQGG